MRNIVIDCDPGHDDAIALCLAHFEKEALNIKGIVTVAGNNTLFNVTNNARLVLQLLKSNVNLYEGCDAPLIGECRVQEPHGKSGMDGISKNHRITYPIDNMNYVDFYKNLLMKDKLTIVAIGPLTNISILLKSHPEVKSNIEELVIMGGGISRGNITQNAEFNIYSDPEAASIVFNSGIPICMCGLDVTEKAFMTLEEISGLNQGNDLSISMYELLKRYYELGKKFKFENAAIHDACTIAYLVKPEMFTSRNLFVDISLEGMTRGMTSADLRYNPQKKSNVKVIVDVKRKEFVKYLCDSIIKLDRDLYG